MPLSQVAGQVDSLPKEEAEPGIVVVVVETRVETVVYTHNSIHFNLREPISRILVRPNQSDRDANVLMEHSDQTRSP